VDLRVEDMQVFVPACCPGRGGGTPVHGVGPGYERVVVEGEVERCVVITTVCGSVFVDSIVLSRRRLHENTNDSVLASCRLMVIDDNIKVIVELRRIHVWVSELKALAVEFRSSDVIHQELPCRQSIHQPVDIEIPEDLIVRKHR